MPDTSLPNAPPEDTTEKPPRWYPVAVLATVFGAIFISQTLLSGGDDAPQQAPPEAAGAGAVSLEIDFDNGKNPTETKIAWSDGLTVLQAVEQASKVDRTGDGDLAFINAIDGLANEGAGGRNWQYYVEGQRGEVSAGARRLEQGDRVLWKFAPYE
ncbi:MAG: DUF4430 domain-containing protein [Planctomycetota bacterium]